MVHPSGSNEISQHVTCMDNFVRVGALARVRVHGERMKQHSPHTHVSVRTYTHMDAPGHMRTTHTHMCVRTRLQVADTAILQGQDGPGLAPKPEGNGMYELIPVSSASDGDD